MQAPAIVQREMPFDRTEVTCDGVRMSVVDDGPRDAEETLVFLHGNPAWSFLWRKLIDPMLDEGHRVVAPDLVGFGMSEKPLSPAYHRLERHILNLEQMADQLDLDDITLIMHDWGGPMGMGLATRRPELVRRLVVANTIAFAPRSQRSLSWWHRIMASPLGGVLGVRMNAVARTAFKLGVNEPLADDVLEAYLWPMEDKGGRVAAHTLVEMVPDGPEHPTARTLTQIQDRYRELKDRPMLVLWADSDPVMRPKFADKWTDTFPEAEAIHCSATAGHFWQEDDPDAFLEPLKAFVERA